MGSIRPWKKPSCHDQFSEGIIGGLAGLVGAAAELGQRLDGLGHLGFTRRPSPVTWVNIVINSGCHTLHQFGMGLCADGHAGPRSATASCSSMPWRSRIVGNPGHSSRRASLQLLRREEGIVLKSTARRGSALRWFGACSAAQAWCATEECALGFRHRLDAARGGTSSISARIVDPRRTSGWRVRSSAPTVTCNANPAGQVPRRQ